jgi:hypothetical protein
MISTHNPLMGWSPALQGTDPLPLQGRRPPPESESSVSVRVRLIVTRSPSRNKTLQGFAGRYIDLNVILSIICCGHLPGYTLPSDLRKCVRHSVEDNKACVTLCCCKRKGGSLCSSQHVLPRRVRENATRCGGAARTIVGIVAWASIFRSES